MNKCDGIKILELDPKRILEGNEYMVIAEKDQNFKAPINQQAMNKGTGVTLALPSANNGKISLPIWTGTEAEYNQLTKVAGMTYNIIDEESE